MEDTNLYMEKVKEMHIIPYSHHDFAWTNSRQWHIRRYLQVFIEVLDVMKEHANLTWMIDNVTHSLLPFIKYCPEKLDELKQRVQEGRIYVANGGYSLVRSTYVGDETFIRNMVEGKRYFQTLFDIANIEFYYNADVGCGHSQLPQLLQLAGHKYYRFQRPEEALDAKQVPRQFIWKGLDGSQVTVSRGTYGGFMDGKFTNQDYKTEWEEVKQQFIQHELVDKVDALLKADIVWLNYGCDDCRPLLNLYDDPIQILEFIAEWNKREEAKLLLSTPGTYFKHLEKSELPVYEGVLDPCELSFNAPLRGNHSMWRMRSKLDRLIVKAESLATIAAVSGMDYPYDKLQELWNQLFEITGHAMEWIYREDFNRLLTRALGAESAAIAMIETLCEDIAAKLQVKQGEQYVIFNILNWMRTELVELHITSPVGVEGFDLYDSLGHKVDYQVVNICDGDKNYSGREYTAVDIVAKMDIPAMGYSGLSVAKNGMKLTGKVKAEFIDIADRRSAPDIVVIHNGVIEARMEKGILSEIREIATGRTIQAASPHGLNGLKFVQTEISPNWCASWDPIESFAMIPDKWELAENGPLRWVYRVSGKVGNNPFKLDIIIQTGERAVSFDLHVDGAGDEGYFAVDFPADPDTYLFADIPFGVEERDLTQESYLTIPGCSINYNTFERGWEGQFYAKSWALFQCGGMPAAIVSENCSIYYNYDANKHLVSLLLNRCMPLENKEERWFQHTHPSVDGRGTHNFKYSLYLPVQNEKFAEVARFAKQKAQPVDAVVKYNHVSKEQLPLEKSLMEIDSDNVIVSACYKENHKMILRLYEAEGKSSTIRISPNFNFSSAALIDLLGNELDQATITVDIHQRCISIVVGAWQIVNLQFELL
ncbi:glycoside hydrolase family 38 N-terminal domain-containing protein [Paenibacillus eucommiae]|uniref:Alpha-mannosidase n=1 Tax=Paenibacillus eucommiae TaxID=1355755 RepID=A0ABS4J357_9BACL|nr:glycosyl hydrolase-related protein [Paenibacillus eucommiae]MBP1994284.1 alpha-mannosidase [Paenibacillus eucommiae]